MNSLSDQSASVCPTCGQHHLAESDVEELHGLLAECERLEREVLAENERLRAAMDAAMTAIQNTDFSKAHRLLYEARHEPASDEGRER